MPQHAQKSYSFRNAADGTPIVQLYGYIGQYENIEPIKFMQEFDIATAGHTDVIFEINCGGGDVVDGFAIIDLLSTRNKKITCRVFGMAASMGFVLMMVGERIEISRNAQLMTHRVSVRANGDADKMAQMASLAVQFENRIVNTIIARTGQSKETVRGWFKSGVDKWFTADEAKALGIVDAIIAPATPSDAAAPPQNGTATEVFNFYNNFLNKPTESTMTVEQLHAFGLPSNATEAQINARIAEITTENNTLKNEVKRQKETAVLAVVNRAKALGLNENQLKQAEKMADWNIEVANEFVDAIGNKPNKEAEPVAPVKTVSLRDAINNKNADPRPDDRRNWSYMDYAKKDPSALQNMTEDQRNTLYNKTM